MQCCGEQSTMCPKAFKFCVAYVDSIVIFSQTMGEHISHGHQAMDRLNEHVIVPKSSNLSEADVRGAAWAMW